MLAASTNQRHPWEATRATGCFVLGFAGVFAALGALAGWLGSSVADAQLWLQRLGGIAIVVFGLLLLAGVAGHLGQEFRLIQRVPHSGRLQSLVMGVAFGAAWTPCVGPLLGAALVAAADAGRAAEGAVLLTAYAAGVGTPFVGASLAVTALGDAGRWLRPTGVVVHRIAGGVLVVLGALLVLDRYAWFTARIPL
jgi:cytochrome c-type biogenesis protein